MIPAQIAERLGISTMVYPPDRYLGQRELAAIREQGIRRIEIAADYFPKHFDYTNREQVESVRKECEALGIQVISFHTPGGIPYSTDDEAERKTGIEKAKQVIDVMLSMGGTLFVMHVDIRKEATKRTLNDLLDGYHDTDLKLVVENGAVLQEYRDFVDRFDAAKVGMVIDVGHACDADGINPLSKPGVAYDNMALAKGRLLHLHLHDWDQRDHIAPYDGRLLWSEIFQALFDIDYPGTFMFEISHEGVAPDGLKKVGRFPERLAGKQNPSAYSDSSA